MARARLHLLGILEMQRHPLAAAHLPDLQQTRSAAPVIAAMQATLRALPALMSAAYSARIHQRLLEALPLEHQSALKDDAYAQTEPQAI